jgi:hypothetical protein
MTLAANALQAGIYARLTNQLGASPAVYDFVPQSSAYPYVVIGDVTAGPWDTKTYDGQEFTVTVHAFDKAAGKKSVQTILQNVYAALHHKEANITVTGYHLVLVRCEFSEAFQDPSVEGDTDRYFHGVQRYRCLVKNT